jgi:plasmid stabilization system protein ParE
MKTYSVIVSATAKQNMRDGYRWAARHAPETAARWLERFHQELQTLSRNPERCSIAPEAAQVGREIRQFLFGRRRSLWRVLFIIEGAEIRVLQVRRASRDAATAQELGNPFDE